LGVLDSLYLAIIGAGSAGFSAAVTAAGQGARVALGGGTIGGPCVNVGCVPSKTLIRAAETLHQARAAQRRHRCAKSRLIKSRLFHRAVRRFPLHSFFSDAP
jgi:pyruvate/2-oxoglutarate dehydrogenase complex dihydrolipoamide dehydrogenase (E3) component